MSRLTKYLFAALLPACFAFKADAQLINNQAAAVVSYDPIAATLDSLVNLTYVKRLSLNSRGESESLRSFEIPTYSPEVYKKRIEKIQTPIPLCYNSEVQEYINLYALHRRGLTERVMGLAGLYFPLFEQTLDQQGLPTEFKYLAIVESALNPTAVSRMGATGLWQFMHATGKLYNLQINSYIDERRDPVLSTYAACQYFKDMYAIYNDWLLVIAAYNCGAGNVNKAIARSGGKRTFWEISSYLPRETRGYVPAFIAVTYLMNYTSEHNLIAVPPLISYYDADTIMTDQKVSLRVIADVTNTPYDLLAYLNPVYKKGIVPESDVPLPIRLPSNKINTYLSSLSTIYKPEENAVSSYHASESKRDNSQDGLVKKYHYVKRGEHLQSIANKYRCTVNDLKRWNRISGSKLMAGQKLAVYVTQAKKSSSTAQSVAPAKKAVTASTNSKLVMHTVEAGDSLWKIAKRYEGATVEGIKQINNLQSNDLKVGTRLKVPLS